MAKVESQADHNKHFKLYKCMRLLCCKSPNAKIIAKSKRKSCLQDVVQADSFIEKGEFTPVRLKGNKNQMQPIGILKKPDQQRRDSRLQISSHSEISNFMPNSPSVERPLTGMSLLNSRESSFKWGYQQAFKKVMVAALNNEGGVQKTKKKKLTLIAPDHNFLQFFELGSPQVMTPSKNKIEKILEKSCSESDSSTPQSKTGQSDS
ncbi:unnamed protein product [Moneuplotes crassus]|uniref:Uncharacterized protein n=1 Tax=Euplotes crassus TaxID=5936 RepID=A0AAD1UJY2_EUPCR|nr:unnamed protein product [Moneuplotes crassus]